MAAQPPMKDLALKYHLLEVMIGTAVAPPVQRFRVNQALAAIRKQLRVTPFVKARVRRALDEMAYDGLVVRREDDGPAYFAVTRLGRETYARYKEVVVLWRLEKRFGEKLELTTVNRVSLRRPREDKFHMPAIGNVKMPLEYRPVRHVFEDDREIRVCEVEILPGRV